LSIPPEVSEEEQLGRRIFSETDLKRARRKIPYRLFYDKKAKEKVSVDRLDLPSSISELIEICDKAVKGRGASGFYGWAVMTAEEASTEEREVKSSWSEENPYHADIILPDSVIDDEVKQRKHAKRLAEIATLRERD